MMMIFKMSSGLAHGSIDPPHETRGNPVTENRGFSSKRLANAGSIPPLADRKLPLFTAYPAKLTF